MASSERQHKVWHKWAWISAAVVLFMLGQWQMMALHSLQHHHTTHTALRTKVKVEWQPGDNTNVQVHIISQSAAGAKESSQTNSSGSSHSSSTSSTGSPSLLKVPGTATTSKAAAAGPDGNGGPVNGSSQQPALLDRSGASHTQSLQLVEPVDAASSALHPRGVAGKGSAGHLQQLSSGNSGSTPPVTTDSLEAVLATASRGGDAAYIARLKVAAASRINIAVMTSLFWPLPMHATDGCQVDGVTLDCHVQMGGDEAYLNKADALYYHVPSFAGKPRPKAFSDQLRIAMSLESAAYYPALDSPGFMCHFDAEMSYRTCAQVVNWYSLESLHKLFDVTPVPFEEKIHAVAYVNSNCGAQSGRSDIMRKLMALKEHAKVPVHSLGRCDNNQPWPPGNPHKIEVFRKYKFCIAMENSVRLDYMTEKIWDALAAGCVPIYLGSSNTVRAIPDPRGMILYDSGGAGNASSPGELDALMHAIGSDKEKYESMVAWKHQKPEKQPSKVFRYLWQVRHTSGECFLCQFLARHRAEPKERYTTCLFDKHWMNSAKQTFVEQEAVCGKAGAT